LWRRLPSPRWPKSTSRTPGTRRASAASVSSTKPRTADTGNTMSHASLLRWWPRTVSVRVLRLNRSECYCPRVCAYLERHSRFRVHRHKAVLHNRQVSPLQRASPFVRARAARLTILGSCQDCWPPTMAARRCPQTPTHRGADVSRPANTLSHPCATPMRSIGTITGVNVSRSALREWRQRLH